MGVRGPPRERGGRRPLYDYRKGRGMLLKRELIRVGVEARDAEEALKTVAQGFVDQGYALPSFPQAVADREVLYATGLPAAGMDVAIPHADRVHVRKEALGIATVREPVAFKMMGSPTTVLHPKILFMLAVSEPHAQIDALQQLMALLRDAELLAACYACDNADAVYELMAARIG